MINEKVTAAGAIIEGTKVFNKILSLKPLEYIPDVTEDFKSIKFY